jgi:hypothetical protein
MVNGTSNVTLPDALAANIKRVQAKRDRWLEYQQRTGHQAVFGPGIALMRHRTDAGIDALASGDPARMIEAHRALSGFNDDD